MFNPDQAFAKNIRASIEGDDTELRESLRAFGWRKELPALADDGVILVGHRRIKIAAELGIEPVIQTLSFGKGDEADAERAKLAIASNIGFMPMTPADRKRIAEHLYGNHEWTMERIAQALNVSQATITGDLRGLSTTDKPSRPKGGRPKASPKLPSAKIGSKTAKIKEILRENPSTPHKELRAVVGGAGGAIIDNARRELTTEDLIAIAREEGRVEGVREVAESQIKVEDLSKTAQEKIAIIMRRAQRNLESEFGARVAKAAQELYDNNFPTLQEEKNDAFRTEQFYRKMINDHKPIFTETEYVTILTCLHPDNSASKGKRESAFKAFSASKFQLTGKNGH